GNGGDGAVSFRREKFVPYGGPDGGDGGKGGDVVIEAKPGTDSLLEFRRRKQYRAGDGGDGKGKNKHGKNGADLILTVPVGTIARVLTRGSEEPVLIDFDSQGHKVIARGGEGGKGNTRFVSSTNQVPRLAQNGEAGEEKSVILELRLIADVGVIGYPNVGKSTLLAAASAAKPKIADYPFTTLAPVLGMVEMGEQRFVLAEIPGLIEDAHLGKGLGHDFLRHAMRTKMLVHVIDGTSESPVEDMIQVNKELVLFDPSLSQKPQLVVINKADLPEVRVMRDEIEEAFAKTGVSVMFISAATGEGVAYLLARVANMLSHISSVARGGEESTRMVFRPRPRGADVSVHREGDSFVLVAPGLERIVARVELSDPEVKRQLRGLFLRQEVRKTLERAGIKPGNKVRCGQFEWEW
ncbi:MAG: GTPase ObgE, partial [Chloroflexi bacterium]|nr:GTPase ObgE [Chloroflexota bacterium]